MILSFQPSCEGGSVSQTYSVPESHSSSSGEVSIEVPLTTNNDTAGCNETVESSSVPAQPIHVEDLPPPKPDFSAPPPYEVAAKLPTYEEVQREKSRLGEPQVNNVSFHF